MKLVVVTKINPIKDSTDVNLEVEYVEEGKLKPETIKASTKCGGYVIGNIFSVEGDVLTHIYLAKDEQKEGLKQLKYLQACQLYEVRELPDEKRIRQAIVDSLDLALGPRYQSSYSPSSGGLVDVGPKLK